MPSWKQSSGDSREHGNLSIPQPSGKSAAGSGNGPVPAPALAQRDTALRGTIARKCDVWYACSIPRVKRRLTRPVPSCAIDSRRCEQKSPTTNTKGFVILCADADADADANAAGADLAPQPHHVFSLVAACEAIQPPQSNFSLKLRRSERRRYIRQRYYCTTGACFLAHR